MHIKLDEEQQEHLYGCLLAGNSEWKGVQKKLAKLNREDDSVERALTVNAGLRKLLNPRAEEEAREAERKRTDPAQMSITDQPPSSGETGGGIPAGQVIKLRIFGQEPKAVTDPELRDALMEMDFLVLLSDIRGWTSSDRDGVVTFLNDLGDWRAAEEELAEPEAPEVLALVAITQERMDGLTRMGPYTTVELFDGKTRDQLPDETDAEPSSVRVVAIGADEGGDKVDREYVDPIEAEIRCARLNRDFIKNADLDPEIVSKWLAAGPWSVVGEPQADTEGETHVWFVVLESEGIKERAADMTDADFTAARYNRSVAGRDDEGNWREPPVRIDSDAVQEIHAAAESAE